MLVEVQFASPDLRRLDELSVEACYLPFFRDERPFRGILGLLDWRMGARLSRQVIRGRLRGDAGELLLLPAGRFFRFEKLVLAGLGRREDFDTDGYSQACARMLQVLSDLRVRTALVALPGRALELIAPEDAIDGLLDAMRRAPERLEQEMLYIAEPGAVQREMLPLLERERRRQRAG
ncbi:MAG: M17 family peptidase N-terminal domain-containing protein [Myxococcota bacterium]